MEQKNVDIENLLQHGETVKLKPQGHSMYPLFVSGRDWAILKKAEYDKLKKGDVVLYRREGSILVLHRICKIKNDGLYMVGDNQREVEGPLGKEQVKGILTGLERRGKYISAKDPLYIMLSRLWLFLRPLRPAISKTVAMLKRLVRKKRR